ncbi:hypothetical protein [Paraburkholderia sp. BCC1885]|uniref:hypothetical protein n=1 Tax=Paraburkholderia sp. BCC1885 TaxID=2562669 RepID=UPI001183ED60|nr:hypothetical protein [Paraburkholderia sp. BCC1885]
MTRALMTVSSRVDGSGAGPDELETGVGRLRVPESLLTWADSVQLFSGIQGVRFDHRHAPWPAVVDNAAAEGGGKASISTDTHNDFNDVSISMRKNDINGPLILYLAAVKD